MSRRSTRAPSSPCQRSRHGHRGRRPDDLAEGDGDGRRDAGGIDRHDDHAVGYRTLTPIASRRWSPQGSPRVAAGRSTRARRSGDGEGRRRPDGLYDGGDGRYGTVAMMTHRHGRAGGESPSRGTSSATRSTCHFLFRPTLSTEPELLRQRRSCLCVGRCDHRASTTVMEGVYFPITVLIWINAVP
jgi:hypothetical protein